MKAKKLIKCFVVDKKNRQKAVNVAFYCSLKKNTLNTEIKKNPLPLYKVKYKWKTH